MSGERTSLLAADAEARRAAQTEFDRPVILEAGAGTGKTTTLVARAVIWCLGRGWEESAAQLDKGDAEDRDQVAAAVLEGVVAITFTEAAAAEMAARVARALAAIAAGDEADLPGLDLGLLPEESAEGERRARARSLLGALDHLTVRTIHAFCRSLLARHPLEAGLHPELTVDADGSRTEEIVRELVEIEARRAYAGDPEHPLLRLATAGMGPRRLSEVLCELSGRGFAADALARSPFEPAGVERMLARLERRLTAFCDAGGEDLGRVKRGTKAPEVAWALGESLGRLRGIEATGLEAACRLRALLDEIWTEKRRGYLKGWGRGRTSQSEASLLGERLTGFAEAASRLEALLRHYARIDPQLLESARLCLEPVLRRVESELRARGVLGFAALLLEARNLLARHRGVRAREQGRLRQLLVDEFQDTDRLQCDLVRLLALDPEAERRPGLFIVGDPKQSIYGWRNADLAAYDAFVDEALAASGERFRLVQNFRSAPPLLAEVGRAIEPIMRRRRGLQPAYEPLIASDRLLADEGFRAAGHAAVEYWLSWPVGEDGVGPDPGAPVDRAAELEARAVAEDIARLHRVHGVPWSDVGILLRATTRLETYLEALRTAAVPFLVSRDKHYYRRREIIEAAALVRTVVNPTDQLALVTWLRSPSVGVPDAAWIHLWRHGFPKLVAELEGPSKKRLEELRRTVGSAAAELPAAVPGLASMHGWEANAIDALDVLATLRRAWREAPADRFVALLRRRLLFDCSEAARFLGEFRVANLDRFFRRLLDSLDERGGDVQAVLRAIRRGVVEAQAAEEALPKETAEDAVQVMTIHAAKGLEFEHVYLVQAHAFTAGGDAPLVDVDERRHPDESAQYSLFGSPTPEFDRVEERRRLVEATERVRTLYVALTRARRRLVVAGRWDERPAAKEVDKARTHLELLGHRMPAAGDAGEIWSGCDDDGAWTDPHGASWVALGRRARAQASTPRTGGAEELPSAEEVRRSARALARHRRAAASRMERPLLRAASAETSERLARIVEAGQGGPAAAPETRDVALAVGEAVHRLFETWSLDADPVEELRLRRRELVERLAASLPAEHVEAATERATALLDRIGEGELLGRFAALGDRVIARELPLVAPGGDHGPLGAWTGAIDLLYRDAETGRPVIADFKTDEVETDEQIAARAEAYRPQEDVYRRAVQEAFELPRPPAFELWFLWPDRLYRGEAR